jgi:hypothetical protein
MLGCLNRDFMLKVNAGFVNVGFVIFISLNYFIVLKKAAKIDENASFQKIK